ncbi:Ff.00g135200.m01.CDS01 [Fusarium sp. VM40]|nr:Ff.00g135200.m01.CDS01 [Fusarium sp. VM40]
MAIDATVTSVTPTGLGRTLLALTILFLIPTTIVIFLRCWIRLRHKIFGVDDGLMLVGWMLYVSVSGIVIRSTYAGLGTSDSDLNAYLQNDGRKFLWCFQVTYCVSLLFLKSSICATLLRIAVVRLHLIIIWCTLVFAILSTTTVIIGLLVICRPISTAWGHEGTCAPTVVIASLGYLVSTGAVVTDWICAVLPIFMLYKSNMKRATKFSVAIILGLAALASLCTIIRLPYVKYYTIIPNYLYNVANIVIWSIVESGIGIVAGSLPSLRKLVSQRYHFDSTTGNSPVQVTPFSGTNQAIITSHTSSALRSRPNRGAGATGLGGGEGDWEQLDGSESSKRIYVKVDLEMQSLDRPTTSRASHRSSEDLVR